MKLKRSWGRAGQSFVVNYRRRCSWPSRVGCASARKLFFFQRKEGVRSGKGARACGKRSVFATLEKKRDIDFGEWVGYYVE